MHRFEVLPIAREIAKSLKERLEKSEAALAVSRQGLISYRCAYTAAVS